MDVGHASAGAGIAVDDRCGDASSLENDAEAHVEVASWPPARGLGAALTSVGPRARRVSACAAIATTCAVVAVMLWTGPSPLRAAGHDLLLPLDAAWRITHGQIPHRDFYSPLGPVFSYWAALWMVVVGPVATIVFYSIIGHGVLLAAAAFFVGRDRLSAFSNWAFSSAVLLMAVAPFPVGWPPEALDTAMCYDRLAFGIVGILALEAALPSARSGARPMSETLLAGVLLGLLPLLQLNFALIGAGTQVLALLLPGHSSSLHRRALWLALGLAVPALLFFVVLGVDGQAFVGDMAMVRRVFDDSRPSAARALGVLVPQLRPAIIAQLLPTVAGVALVALAGTVASLWRAAALGLIFCYLLAADLALGVSNTQRPSLMLLPLMPLITLEVVRRGTWFEPEGAAPRSRPSRWLCTSLSRSALTLVAVCLLLFGVGKGPLSALAESVAVALHPPARHHLVGRGFEAEVPFPRTDAFPLGEADGLRLLQKHLQPGDKLVTLDVSNPFNFALGLTPARGDALGWHEGKTFSRRTHLQAERVFADADWIIAAKRGEREVMPVYRGFIRDFYVDVDSTAAWTLYKRRTRFTI